MTKIRPTQIQTPGDATKYLDGTGNFTTPPGSSGGYATVQDEGSALTARSTIDFVGAGVTATDDSGGSRTVVTIPGVSGGGGSSIIERADPNYHQATPAFVRDFGDSETADWTVTESGSRPITVTKKLGKLSILHNGGTDASAELHAVTWPYSPGATDFYIDCAFRWLTPSATFSLFGLIVADGTTYGSGSQVFMSPNWGSSGGTFQQINRLMTGFNTQGTTGGSINYRPFGGDFLYARLARSGSNWIAAYSLSGVGWMVDNGTPVSSGLTVSRIGFAISTWGSSAGPTREASIEYIAAYTGSAPNPTT